MRKLLILFLIGITFVSCSLLREKKEGVATPDDVFKAIMIDDNHLLNKYLAEGFPVEYENSEGKTLLKLVLENNSLNSLDILLVKGVDIEKRDIKNGKTPIFYVRSLEALKKLIEDGANINARDEKGESVLTYFIKNKPMSYAEFLSKERPDFNLIEGDNWSSVFWAGVSGNSKLIEIMRKNGADFTQIDEKGNYPIYYAYDEENIIELLKVPYDLTRKNNSGENILGEVYLRAVANGYISVIERVLELGVNPQYMSYGDRALSIALDSKNQEIIEYLKLKGIK